MSKGKSALYHLFAVSALLSVFLYFVFEVYLAMPYRLSWDMSTYLSFAQLKQDHSLYQNDYLYLRYAKMFSPVYLSLLNVMFKFTSDWQSALLLLAGLLLLIAMLGFYFLFYHFTASRLSSFLSCIAAVIVKPPGIGGEHWGLKGSAGINMVTPRDVIFAFFPFFVLYFIKFSHSRKLIIPFLFLGLLGSLHPISAFHIFFLFILAAVFTMHRRAKEAGILSACILIFFTAILPFLTQLFASSAGVSQPTVLISPAEAFRIYQKFDSYLLWPPSQEKILLTLFHFLPIFILSLCGFYLRKKSGSFGNADKALSAIFILAVLMACAQGIFQSFPDFFTRYTRVIITNQLRVTKYVYLPVFIFFAYFLKYLFASKEAKKKSVALAAALIIIGPPQIAKEKIKALTSYNKTVLKETNKLVISDTTSADFLEMCAWIKANTPKEAVFLAPPDEARFRLFSQRSALSSVNDRGLAWNLGLGIFYESSRRYEEIAGLYKALEESNFLSLARRYGAGYIITPANIRLSAPPVYHNQTYRVYRAQ